MTEHARPEPLTPVDCDLRDFAFMPLDVLRLRDSDLAIQASGEEFRCAVLLWCASWHQSPAASLPDDDATLSALAGFGRAIREWKRVRAGALRGWVLCNDGRLYHPVVAEKALDAWKAKLMQRWRTEIARVKKHNQRHQTDHHVPDFEDWVSLGCPQGQSLSVPKDSADRNEGQAPNVPRETPSKGQGEGQEQGDLSSVPDGTGGKPPAKSPEEMTKDELWQAGKSLLLQAGMPEKQCGSYVGKLVKDYKPEVVIDAVRTAVVERPADPASFLKATCQRIAGERKPQKGAATAFDQGMANAAEAKRQIFGDSHAAA